MTFIATAFDVDVPVQTLLFSLGGSVPSGAGITGGGVFTWSPTEGQGPDVYTFDVVVSGGFFRDCETIEVTVRETNVAPVLDSIGPQCGDEQTLIAFIAPASAVDVPFPVLLFILGVSASARVRVAAVCALVVVLS